MLNHARYKQQSRREVQRRFPPGSFYVRSDRLFLIVGWAPTPSGKHGYWHEGTWRVATIASSWVAYVLKDQRLMAEPWEYIRDCKTVEEWENGT